jgi:hypothetical protein
MRNVILFVAAAVGVSPAFAIALNSAVYAPVPALDDLGLAALALIVAVAGGIVARGRGRNKKK